MRNSRILGGSIVVVGALVAIIGSLLPWARIEGSFLNASKSGTQGDGVLTLIAGVIIIVMGALMLALEQSTFASVIAVLGGLGCAAVAVLDLVDLTGRMSGLSTEYVTLKAGEGIYMVLVAGIIVMVGSIVGLIGSINKGKKPVSAAAPQYSCPYCGNPVVEGARFCIRCGRRFY